MNALEIDYLPVGDGTKSGDAIAMRFGNYENAAWKSQYVITIDGGNKDSGQRLANHVKEVYKSKKVDLAILTHPDGDHASGMKVLLEDETLTFGEVWMHRPWRHWEDLKNSIKDGRITKKSFGETLTSAYQFAYDVEQVALRREIPITAPHQGCFIHFGDNVPILQVLAPGKDFYLDLIRASQKTPEMTPKEVLEKSQTFSEQKKEVSEDLTFQTENLQDDGGETSAENDMSLIMLLNVAGKRILFTGDAGTMGLYKAIYYSIERKIDLNNLEVFHVPHHGSRRNLSKGILKHISAKYAYISCSAGGAPSHPSAIVTNALIRRNMIPYSTKNVGLSHHAGPLPSRPGYSAATPIPFSPKVLIDK